MADADVRIGGRYRLDRQLASGGMGSVWLGWDESLRRAVAVKRLHLRPGLSSAEREQAVERAMREGRITARLQHPNAVPVYDVVDDDQGPCLVMQYVPSRSLAAVVTEDGPLAPPDVARIGTQLAAALAAAHRVGIVHRDVKPANVLIADDGTARITDFGVSHAMDDVAITSTGMVTGTPGFLAPEVARGEASTFAGDVYSLGSTLYLAVEGVAPFGAGPNPMALLHRVASGRPRPPERAGALAADLRRMMAPSPADRPSMVEIAGRLPDVHPLSDARDLTDEIVGRPDESDTREIPRVTAGGPTVQQRRPPRTDTTASDTTASDTTASDTTTSDTTASDTQVPHPPASLPSRPDDEPPGDHPPGDDRSRRRVVLPAVAALLVVVLGLVLAFVLLRDRGGDDDSAGGPAGPATSTSVTASAPSTGRPSSTRPSSSANPPSTGRSGPPASPTRPTRSTSPSGRSSGPVTAAQLAGAVVSYFALIPGDLDGAWGRLTPGFQQGRAGGRGTFDQYWNSVSRVDVSGASGSAPDTASALLVYHYRDGRVVQQRTTFRIVRQGGVLKIAAQY